MFLVYFMFVTDKKVPTTSSKSNSQQNSTPSFTIKRSFTAKNSGQLPFYVQSFSINNLPCEGYGFRVVECGGFSLEPNASKKIEIMYV